MAEETTSNPVVAATEGVTNNGPDAQSQQTQTAANAAPETGKQGVWREKFQDDPDKLWEAYRNAQAQLTRLQQQAKQSGSQIKDDLLGKPAEPPQGQPAQTQAEQLVRDAGGDDAEVRALREYAARHGWERASLEAAKYYAKIEAQKAIQEHLAPIQQHGYENEMRTAYMAIQAESGMEWDEFQSKVTPKLREFIAARPKVKQQLQQAESARDMYEILDFVYNKVQKETAQTVSKAAQAAGAKREQERSQMAAAAAVESGRGPDMTKTKQSNPADDWAAAAQAYDKGKRLFND